MHISRRYKGMRPYSIDLRERVVQACDAKRGTQGEIAKLFDVSLSWIQKLLRRRRETGTLEPKPHGGGPTPKFKGASLDALKKDLQAHPDASLHELLERSGVKGSIMAVQRALERLGCRRKKSRFTRRSKSVRT